MEHVERLRGNMDQIIIRYEDYLDNIEKVTLNSLVKPGYEHKSIEPT